MSDAVALTPIGWVRCSRAEPEDDSWDSESAVIELDTARFGAEALQGLDTFSHVEILYVFHATDPAKAAAQSRHPRGNPDWPRVGIFAQRNKDRPNHLGATICRVVKVEGTRLHVAGLDAIDGSPVLDIKPWMQGFAPRGETREPQWATELMRGYW